VVSWVWDGARVDGRGAGCMVLVAGSRLIVVWLLRVVSSCVMSGRACGCFAQVCQFLPGGS